MFKIVLIHQGSNAQLFLKKGAGELQSAGCEFEAVFYDAYEVDEDEGALKKCLGDVGSCDFLYMDVHGGLPYFRRFEDVQKVFAGRIPSFVSTGIEDETEAMRLSSILPEYTHFTLMRYKTAGGAANMKSMLIAILNSVGHCEIELADVAMPKWNGVFGEESEEDGEEKKLLIAKSHAHTPVVGLLIHYHSVEHDDTEHIEAIIGAIRANGAVPFPVFSNMMPYPPIFDGLKGTIRDYFMDRDGNALIDSLIVAGGHTLSFLASPSNGESRVESSVFEGLGVAAMQALSTFFDYDGWRSSLAGIDSMLLCSSVYQPEFDGQMTGRLIAYTETVETEYGPKYKTKPIAERVDALAKLAVNWAKLKRKKGRDRKIAIVLHNMPPRADMIGAAFGLDSLQSVYHMYETLKAEGIKLDYSFEDGADIIARIAKGLTNDTRFLDAREALERSGATAKKDVYEAWFSAFPEKNRLAMTRDWGEAPGEFMAVGEEILIPGIFNGNLYIGLQPPRALAEKAESAYHSTDIVCPWQYIAFYRYLKDVFEVDCIVHVGTHGTLEWLPGKEIGLSEECYPDLAIQAMPHVYPYIIDVPGEGAQAKRRSAAVIIDHLIPSMTESGTYGDLSDVEARIFEYNHAKILGGPQLSSLPGQIYEMAHSLNLDCDLGIDEESFFHDPSAAIERLHVWISEIKTSKIRDGLHIFGQVPTGERYKNLLRLLVGVKNGPIPSLRMALAALNGLDLEELLLSPGKVGANGLSNAQLLDRVDEEGREIFGLLEEGGYTQQAAQHAMERYSASPSEARDLLASCLSYVLGEIKPRLDRTGDEMASFSQALRGGFVKPGPSGAPSRGNADILPTGRNFYMVDPTAIPSRASWETGQRLARDLLARHSQAHGGETPEGVSIVVYCGETIATGGDDIAEIMYLYGVRPLWVGNTNRVYSLEAIPLEELGRPRVDVTLRISGLFRDAFPNLIEKIEDAVNLVASLDEPDSQNYVKKHVGEEIAELVEQGVDVAEAMRVSGMRVFGCPPGTYGAGVDILVQSKQWEAPEDLGRAYVNYSSHAYGRKWHGEKVPETFLKRLSKTQVTVKNISSDELDMLSDDDFYNYHGGMISAVKLAGGNADSYSTSAADAEHVKTRTIHEDTSRIMRMRIENPKWIEGLKEHGYRGATEFAQMVDIVFGWDATSGVVDDWMYESIAKTYLLDDELREWIRSVNPWALHAMSERLLEAAQRGMWNAGEETLEALRSIYLEMDGAMEGI